MLLHDLISQLGPVLNASSVPNIPITGIREDSRLVTPGDLFIARAGSKADGAKFIADARARGAAAVLSQGPADPDDATHIVVENVAGAASFLANVFKGSPSQSVRVLGVTGTNGKTTVAYLVRHLLSKINQRCGLVGTVEIDDGKTRCEATMTTPSACEIADLLATMRDNECRACAIEVSSHALDQGRVAGVQFAGAAFTNLTGDHLDYHKTMDAYADAKARLFHSLEDSAVAVINEADAFASKMVEKCAGRVVRFGFGTTAEYRASEPKFSANATHFILHTPDGEADVQLPMIGRHNVENALAAAALVGETFGMNAQQIAAAFEDAHGAPGRLQAIRVGQPFAVLVDYAHTDDALENVLSALRPLTRGKLRVLFGCGGDRDRTKRPRMAKVAERLADAVYITSDNPRTEDARGILDEIAAGLSQQGKHAAVIHTDRRAAIATILTDAQPGDVVLIAGKGHENYQEIAGQKYPFDDAEEANLILRSAMNDLV